MARKSNWSTCATRLKRRKAPSWAPVRFPLATLTGSLAALDRTAPVVVYCASGSRSHVASSVLREAGFTDVSDLLGGYAAWEAAGLPVTAGPASGERRTARS